MLAATMICLVFIYVGFWDDLLSLYKGGPEAVLHEIVTFLTAWFFVEKPRPTKSRPAAKSDWRLWATCSQFVAAPTWRPRLPSRSSSLPLRGPAPAAPISLARCP